jgi:hypothetical protein
MPVPQTFQGGRKAKRYSSKDRKTLGYKRSQELGRAEDEEPASALLA